MGAVSKDKMVIGFMVSKHVMREIDKHAKMFKSRSEFVGKAIEIWLDHTNSKRLEERLFARVAQAVGAMLVEGEEAGDGELVPVQAVLPIAYVEQVDRFAEQMKLSRVNAMATLVEMGLQENAVILRTVLPVVHQIKKKRGKQSGGIGGAREVRFAP